MLGNYLKMAWKVLRRRKFFTFISLFGIGFTLTVLMVVVSIIDHQLSPSYPETRLDRMLLLDRMQMEGDRSIWSSGPGYRFVERYGRDLPGVERMSVFTRSESAVSFKEGRKQTFATKFTDAEYWRILQFDFLEGAPFTVDDDLNANRVAVISDGTRRRFFGDAPGLDETIELDGARYRVIGVVRDVPVSRVTAAADIWLPLHCNTSAGIFDRMISGFQVAYLVEEGVDRKQVQADFGERLTRVEYDDPDRFHTMRGVPMTKLERMSSLVAGQGVGEMAPRRFVLFAILAMLLFMALPAINLVNINLSRIYERSGEIGVRKAFGAAGPDLVLQFVVENVVLCLIGGVIGLVGAFAALRIATLFPNLPLMTFHLNWRVFLAAFLIAIVFGLLSGVWPAWKMSRQHPVNALKGGTS